MGVEKRAEKPRAKCRGQTLTVEEELMLARKRRSKL